MGGVVEVANVDGPDGDTDQGDNLRTHTKVIFQCKEYKCTLYNYHSWDCFKINTMLLKKTKAVMRVY